MPADVSRVATTAVMRILVICLIKSWLSFIYSFTKRSLATVIIVRASPADMILEMVFFID